MERNAFVASMSALLLLLLLCLGGWNEAYAEDRKVFVLCYHSFLGNKRFDGDVSMEDFRSQIDYFLRKGIHFVSYSDLLNGTVTGSRNVLMVIDDGNQSVYQAYHQILEPRHIKPMLAIYPRIIGRKPYALTWDQLRELSQHGCDVAAHGYYHLLLNQKLFDKDRALFNKEIYASKEVLEKMLNVRISAFVYPDGVRSDITKKTLKEAGYAYAFTIDWGPLLYPLSLNKDPYELPRYMIYKNNWGMVSNSILKASAHKH
jgi:peptidoglycan/xylan/chitin deacetylase (PgdA/CDA1 family)